MSTANTVLLPGCPHCGRGAPPTIITDRSGQIVEVTVAATGLLNLSQRAVEYSERTLAFFFECDRERIYRAQQNATLETSAPFGAVLRPRDRAPRRVYTHVRELPDGFLEWIIHPVQPSPTSGTST